MEVANAGEFPGCACARTLQRGDILARMNRGDIHRPGDPTRCEPVTIRHEVPAVGANGVCGATTLQREVANVALQLTVEVGGSLGAFRIV